MAKRNRFSELAEEFRAVVVERSNITDAILPPVAFLILNAFIDLQIAMWGSLGIALALTVFRLIMGRPVGYALGGLGATVLAILAARLSNQAAGYFLPSLITDGLIILACLMSVVAKRPLVALTSHLARQWPLEWYSHQSVRPAYAEVTLAWAIFFTFRLAIKWFLFQEVEPTILGILSVIMGWPATILLLVLSYLYGTWRLQNLGGPSVEEFREDADPPWKGQQRGF
jgi:hypothetical protein